MGGGHLCGHSASWLKESSDTWVPSPAVGWRSIAGLSWGGIHPGILVLPTCSDTLESMRRWSPGVLAPTPGSMIFLGFFGTGTISPSWLWGVGWRYSTPPHRQPHLSAGQGSSVYPNLHASPQSQSHLSPRAPPPESRERTRGLRIPALLLHALAPTPLPEWRAHSGSPIPAPLPFPGTLGL